MNKEKLDILLELFKEASNQTQLLGLFKHLAEKPKEMGCNFHFPCHECPLHRPTDICGASFEQRETTSNYARELLAILDKPPVVKEI